LYVYVSVRCFRAHSVS